MKWVAQRVLQPFPSDCAQRAPECQASGGSRRQDSLDLAELTRLLMKPASSPATGRLIEGPEAASRPERRGASGDLISASARCILQSANKPRAIAQISRKTYTGYPLDSRNHKM